MAGLVGARCNLGSTEANSGNMERAVKHWTIAASAGDYTAMQTLRTSFEKGHVSRESIDSTLAAYNNSCAEMRSKPETRISDSKWAEFYEYYLNRIISNYISHK